MRNLLFVAATALALSPGLALAAGQGSDAGSGAGGGNGGATPPHVSATAPEGSPNAVPPSYGVSANTPTGAAPSSNHYPGQGPENKTFSGQPTTGATATVPAPSTATR